MLNPITANTWRLTLLLFTFPLFSGCSGSGPSHVPTEPERRAMLSLMLPTEIKILPFTRIASFDKDDVPDGVIIVVRPADQFGEAVKAAGLFYFELYSFQQGSSERKGQRLAFWEQVIDTPDKVAAHWNHAEMYEFKLGWPEGATSIRPGNKYILMATYRSPWDETITDEHIMTFTLPPRAVQQASEKKPTQTAPGR